ncbi:MAG: sialidase family protein [Armatimonadota bacterium]
MDLHRLPAFAAHGLVVVLIAALLPAACADPGQFVDTFDTFPGDADRRPFTWLDVSYDARLSAFWTVTDGALEYRATGEEGLALRTSFRAMGLQIRGEQPWTLEAGFRHVAGEAPRPAYETIAYLIWPAAEEGRMHILALMHDAPERAVVLYNATGAGEPVAADLTGGFHALRVASADGELRVWLDGDLLAGPVTLMARDYAATPALLLGPATSGDANSVHCQWDYLAFTDAGGFAPGEGDWTPASQTEPVAEGLSIMEGLPDNADYPGITVLERERGGETWNDRLPELWRRLSAQISEEPRQIQVPFYDYPDEEGPSVQNVYPDTQALRYDERRGVAVAMLTRGIGDTATGYVDYKLWYRVTTNGGETWDDLRPLVDEGEQFSPMHPNPYVWIGKNGFCYASIPPMLKMSNGEILMPYYYAPIDEDGQYYNPLGAYTFGYVAAEIGRWDQAGDDLIWTSSEPVEISERRSARGFSEAAVIELSTPGHILMVLRGSNQPDPFGDIPPVKWRSLSTDYGRTWSEPEPFTYADGTQFMSPSSCSAFIRSSETGRAYWVGNISRTLPRGNAPRYPLIIGELDEETLGLRRATVTIIDDLRPEDPPSLQLSNFRLFEDPETKHILVYLSRYMPEEHRDNPGYGAHTYIMDVR